MEAKVNTKYIRMSARKINLVLALVRGKAVEDAINTLMYSTKRAAKVVYQSLNSAIANAEQTKKMDIDNLFIKSAIVNEGPMLKRFMPRAQGRAMRVRKRMAHLTIVLDEI